MKLTLDNEHRQFAASIDDVLTDGAAPAAARSWALGDHGPGRAIWQRLTEIGVPALAVPEAHGGLDAGAIELVTALRVLGNHAMPGPLVETLAAVPALLAELSDVDEWSGWLPAIAQGALASYVAEPHVPYALDADVAAVTIAAGVGAVRRAAAGEQLSSVDATRRLFTADPVGPASDGDRMRAATERALRYGVLGCAAQQLGLGERLLRMSVEHVTTRHQFGRPVGEYQAVKHQLADVHIGLELARPLLHAAALAVDAGTATRDRDIPAAKLACTDAAHRAARTALQVHGAIGYTSEHDLSLWLTKTYALEQAWGTRAWHRERVLAR